MILRGMYRALPRTVIYLNSIYWTGLLFHYKIERIYEVTVTYRYQIRLTTLHYTQIDR